MTFAATAGWKTFRNDFLIGFLTITFALGFLAGAIVVASADCYASLAYRATTVSATAFGVFFRTVFTYLLTALIYKLGRGFLFLLSFSEAFTFGVAVSAINMSFGSAGWLVCTLMLFSSTITLISWLWFWYRNISGQRCTALRDFVLSLGVASLASIIDLVWISPYLGYLFD